MTPDRAEPIAPRRRLWSVVRATIAGHGLAVVFVVALVAGVLLHLNLGPLRRVVVARVTALLEPIFAGKIAIDAIGATLACLFLDAVFGKVGMLGATEPGAHIHDWQAMLLELVLTVGLVSTILGTASRAQNVGALSALAVAGYIILAGLWSSPVSGASMNPARSFGPDLVIGDFAHFWVYLVGPLAGATIAVGIAWILRGRGDAGGMAAARGLLDPTVRDAMQTVAAPDSKPPA